MRLVLKALHLRSFKLAGWMLNFSGCLWFGSVGFRAAAAGPLWTGREQTALNGFLKKWTFYRRFIAAFRTSCSRGPRAAKRSGPSFIPAELETWIRKAERGSCVSLFIHKANPLSCLCLKRRTYSLLLAIAPNRWFICSHRNLKYFITLEAFFP